jgi:uncharacterized lipoprotein YmbA
MEQYLHPMLSEKAKSGYEPAVIKQMEAELLKEVANVLRKNNLSAGELEPKDRANTLNAVFTSMIGKGGNLASRQFDGFDDMYEATRATMTQWPAAIAKREVEASRAAVLSARTSITKEMEEEYTMRVNAAMEGAYTQKVIHAASLARVLEASGNVAAAQELREAYKPRSYGESFSVRAIEAADEVGMEVKQRAEANASGFRPVRPR